MLGPGSILALPGAFVATVRDPGRERAAIAQIAPELAGYRYLLLTTFKRDGTPVATPVWFAAHDGRLVVASQAGAWKVRRLRRNPRALGAGCDVRGNPLGPTIELSGDVLSAAARDDVEAAIDQRYGLAAWGFRQLARITGRSNRDYLALVPAAPGSSSQSTSSLGQSSRMR